MSKFVPKPGSAVAWKPKAPNHPLSVKCVAHRAIAEGEEFEVAIWHEKEKKSDTSPDYTGKVQDKWQKQQGYDANGSPVEDSIPF